MSDKENYFKNHPGYDVDIEKNNQIMIHKYISDLEKQGVFISKTFSVFEIGFGTGNFATYCKFKGISDYSGVDIDNYYGEKLNKLLPNYDFLKDSFQDFLKDKSEEYDLMFTSHIVEHLEKDELFDMVQCIYKSLKKGGIWINYMPNANSTVNGLNMRYCDITHINLYNNQSFEQIIRNSGCNFSKIYHLNDRPVTFVKRLINKLFINLTKIYYLGMMQTLPQYHSINLISIIKK